MVDGVQVDLIYKFWPGLLLIGVKLSRPIHIVLASSDEQQSTLKNRC